MKTYQQIIDDMQNVSSDMAKIIGRYKGSMSVFADEIKYIIDVYSEEIKYLSKNYSDDYLKSRLEYLLVRMENVIAENEKAFDDRGKREVEEAA